MDAHLTRSFFPTLIKDLRTHKTRNASLERNKGIRNKDLKSTNNFRNKNFQGNQKMGTAYLKEATRLNQNIP